MSSSKRIAVNALATYSRSIFSMALGLFSSRWILQSLGEQDYGLYSVVGSLIIFITFLNTLTSGSISRFFAFSIGQGDPDETNQWFNTALLLHTVIPFFLLAIGCPLGEWAVRNFLNIPIERLPTCIWVFRLSLVSAFVCMASAPYIGMHTAKQRIAELALWGSLNTIFAFSLAYYLTKYKGDTLLAYSVGLVGITIIFQMVQVFRARCMFPECRIKVRYLYDKARLRQVLSFSGWRLFGSLGAMLRNQGTAILLNKYFSPVSYPYVNASYSVANNVSSYTQTLSTALLGAFTPEITATEGRGDRERVLVQASRASKFGTYLILLFAIPLMFEIDYVLVIWLKNPPQLAGIFCRLILTMFIIDKITFGQQVAVSAKGDIAGYQMTVGGCLLLTLPIAWLFLHLGYGATSVGWAFLITFFFCSAGRLFWARYLVGLSVVAWIRIVFFPCVTVLLAGVSIGVLIQSVWIQASFFRFCTLTASTVTSSLLLGWMIVLNEPEKFVVKGGLLRIVNRITKSIFACLAGRS